MQIRDKRSIVPGVIFVAALVMAMASLVLFSFAYDPLAFGFPVLGYYPWAFASGEPTYSPHRMLIWEAVLMPLYLAVGVMAALKESGFLSFVFMAIPVISIVIIWMRFCGMMSQMH